MITVKIVYTITYQDIMTTLCALGCTIYLISGTISICKMSVPNLITEWLFRDKNGKPRDITEGDIAWFLLGHNLLLVITAFNILYSNSNPRGIDDGSFEIIYIRDVFIALITAVSLQELLFYAIATSLGSDESLFETTIATFLFSLILFSIIHVLSVTFIQFLFPLSKTTILDVLLLKPIRPWTQAEKTRLEKALKKRK
jgi:hypothetical protein